MYTHVHICVCVYIYMHTYILFLEQFQVYCKIWQNVHRIPTSLPRPCTQPLQSSTTRISMVHLFVTINEPTLTHHYQPKSIVYIRVYSLYIIQSMDFDKCIMTCIHSYNVMQNNFTTLKISQALPVHPCLPTTPYQPTTYLPASLLLFYPEYHTVGIIKYVAFTD